MKKTINIFVSIAMVFGAFFAAFAVGPPAAAAVNTNTEILYLADSMNKGDGITRIYQVDLESVPNVANLTPIKDIPLDQVDALAASADGRFLYAIDKDTSMLGSLAVETGVFTLIGPVKLSGGANITGIVLAATDPSEDLYVASQDTDEIYIVNKTTGIATSQGKVSYNGTTLNLIGADLVFATNGSMYIWTNGDNAGSVVGLYFISKPRTLPLTAIYLGDGSGQFFTGLAIRNNGIGDLVGSNRDADTIVEISKANASMTVSYRMYLNGNPYSYTSGDMTAGPIIHALVIDKTVNVSYDRTWEWDVNKSSTTTALTLMPSATSTVNYDVNVIATSTDSDWTVSGEITIHNPNIMAAVITSVSDVVGTTTASTTCDVVFPYTLGPDETLVCDYTAVVPAGDTTNVATVVTQSTGLVPGDSVQKSVTAVSATTNEVDDTATLNDDKYGVINGTLVATSTPYTFPYSLVVGLYANSGDYEFENIATVTAGDTKATSSDNHVVDITVPVIDPLHIDKTVNVDYNRTWVWDVDKISTTTTLTLETGETSMVNYDLTVTATSTDSNWTVSGEITIHNPNIMAAVIESVSDVVGTTTASTTCDVVFPYTLGAEETLICKYTVVVPAGNTTNTATVVTDSTKYVPGNSVQKDVIGSLPTTYTDETATLNDNKYSVINGTLVATSTPYYFDYALLVGPYANSGDYEFENIATVTAGDTKATSSDNHVIDVNVLVATCTYTQGYWKTHSYYGPAPYDATWDGLENTNFYSSGQTYYKVLWTAPKGGNAYYQLAHQYIAAELNVLNGASVPANVSTALVDAEALFNAYTPTTAGALKGNSSIRKQFLNLASLLASYNEGKIGPGHCE